jgi:hypothetical protein
MDLTADFRKRWVRADIRFGTTSPRRRRASSSALDRLEELIEAADQWPTSPPSTMAAMPEWTRRERILDTLITSAQGR